MSKKFNWKIFRELTAPSAEQWAKGMGEISLALFPPERRAVESMLMDSSDVETLTESEALQRLKDIRKALLKGTLIINCSDYARALWKLIKTAYGDDRLKFHKCLLYFLEISNCGLLMSPEMGRLIWEWKIDRNSKWLRLVSQFIAPGTKMRGIGGSNKKWSPETTDECFARTHEKLLIRKNLTSNSAAKLVAKEMRLRNHRVVSRKYKERLVDLSRTLSKEAIDCAAITSLQ